jgi:hypothetical protein
VEKMRFFLKTLKRTYGLKIRRIASSPNVWSRVGVSMRLRLAVSGNNR